MTGDVDVTPNANEIRDHKYVSKQELQAMFDEPCAYSSFHQCMVRILTVCAANSFTPWFKLIARDFLFGWWDELLARKVDGKVVAKSLNGVADGSKVVKMV